MEGLFYECVGLESVNLKNFKTDKVISMKNMFGHCTSLKEIDLSNFNTKNVENMEFMVSECENLSKVNLSGFDCSKASMQGIFYQCTKLKKEGIITKEKKIIEAYEKSKEE